MDTTVTFVDQMASGNIISPPCPSGDRHKYSPRGTHAFDPFVELMKFLQEFEHTVSMNHESNDYAQRTQENQGKDWCSLEQELQKRQSSPDDMRKSIRDLLALLDIQLSLMHVELGRHLAELEAQVLPFIHQYQSLRKQCDSAFSALQSRATISEVCSLPYRRPHEAVVKWYTENEEFFATNQQLKTIGRTYCQYPSALLNGIM
jgi:hypothetical protein